MGAEVTTKLLRVDLKHRVATYLVTIPNYITKWIVHSIITYMTISAISTVVTNVERSYYLPDGKLYTVVKVPTRFLADVRYITNIERIITRTTTQMTPPRTPTANTNEQEKGTTISLAQLFIKKSLMPAPSIMR